MVFPVRKVDVMRRLLLCTDLDRTLIPNGVPVESPHAKELLEQLVERDDVTLAYVTGRHRELIEQAIAEYDLPVPHYAIADVGTSIYQVASQRWRPWQNWSDHLAADWVGFSVSELGHLLESIPGIRLQEAEKLSQFKLSFYSPMNTNNEEINALIETLLQRKGIRANLIWSIDEAKSVQLLDVLPANASKLRAIRFVMQQDNFHLRDTVFAGDSGNDVDVFASEIPSVLVANADAKLKSWALQLKSDSLYVAQGGPLGMNGNYRAGILEGVMHYWPESVSWLSGQTTRKDL